MNNNLDILYSNLKIEGNKIVSFGKYKGIRYEYIYNKHPSYCAWCLTLTASTFSMYDFQQYVNKMRFF